MEFDILAKTISNKLAEDAMLRQGSPRITLENTFKDLYNEAISDVLDIIDHDTSESLVFIRARIAALRS